MIPQKTIKNSIHLQGYGLHSGRATQLTLHPALPNTGILFVRSDLPLEPAIPAHYKFVVNTQLATTLGNGKATISTVEHLLAALQGLEIDNLLIEVDGPEIPIMDGSSAPFCDAILESGIETQLSPRNVIAIRRRIEVKKGDKIAVAEPSSHFEIQGSIEWNHPSIGKQSFKFIQGETSFASVAGARTFGFMKDVEAMQRIGLALGGSLDNAIVLDDQNVLNPDGLRFKDEFARHKVLDAMGDFMLAGGKLQGLFQLSKAGHDMHSLLLTEIFKDPANYQVIQLAPHPLFQNAGKQRHSKLHDKLQEKVMAAMLASSYLR